MTVMDSKLDNLLNNWFFAKGTNHEIQLMFREYDLTDFDKFLGYNKQLLLDMRHKKNSVSTPFNSHKIKMINNDTHSVSHNMPF